VSTSDRTSDRTKGIPFARLRAEARDAQVPESLIDLAQRVVGEAAERWPERSAEARSRRATAFFWGVVRRRAFSTHRREAAGFRRRLVAATLVADLRSAGWEDPRIYGELVSTYGETLSMEALADYRAALWPDGLVA